jgi:DNA-directed RNA polymerase subunit beta'
MTPCIASDARPLRGEYFSSFRESLQAYNQAIVGVHTPVWVRFHGLAERDLSSDEPLEIRLTLYGSSRRLSIGYQEIGNLRDGTSSRFVRTTIGRILVNSSLHLI